MAARLSFSKLFSGVITIGLVARRLTRGTPPAQKHAIAPPLAVAPHAPAPHPVAPAARRAEAHAEHRDSQPAKRDGLREPKYKLLFHAVSRFMDDDWTTMSAALAYYTTFSIAPLLLIV